MDRLRNVRGTTLTLLIVGCLCLLLLVVMNLVFGSLAQNASEKVNTSREVRSHAVSMLSALQTAEASQRGYLLTGNEIYLAPFATALDEAERALSDLRERDGLLPTGDYAFQKLEVVIQEKIVELETTVDQYRSGKRDDVLEIVTQNRGKALMDEARVFVSAIVRKAERDLTAGVALQQNSLRTVQISTYIAVIAVFLVTAGVYFIQRSFVRDLRTANEQVQSLNAELEARVEERTQQLKQARDRAEVLLAEVNHRVANSLTMVASMVGMQARASGDEETKRILADTQARINAVSVVHKQLYTSSNVQSVALPDFLPKLLEQIEGAMRSEGLSATVRKEIEPIEMPTDQAISLGIILTEWVTNAFKYAYPAGVGEIRVKLVRQGDGLAQVSVEDDGVGFGATTVPKGTGLGSKLVSAMAASLGGTVKYLNRNPGTEARMVLPL